MTSKIIKKYCVVSICMITAFLLSMSGTCFAGSMKPLKESKNEMTYQVTVNPRVKPFQVRLLIKHVEHGKEYKVVSKIEIYRGKKLLQTFPVDMQELFLNQQVPFGTDDMNFDGYDDLWLDVSWGATGNDWYSQWLYNPVKDRFEYNKQLSVLCSPGADKESKTVHSWSHGGGVNYTIEIYKWAGKKLVLMRAVDQYEVGDTGTFNRVIKERRNGKMIVVSDTNLTGAEAAKEYNEGKYLKY